MTLIDYVYLRSEEIGDCWEWTGALKTRGTTPLMRYKNRTISVRRLIMVQQGLDVKGKLAASKCGNKICVNPEHLELITRKGLNKRTAIELSYTFNMLRKAKISVTVRARSKLTAELADEIKLASGSQRDIARRYSISQSTVSMIKRGRTWRDYLNPFAQLIK
jgi:predicted XRE-type DNA-binding protein